MYKSIVDGRQTTVNIYKSIVDDYQATVYLYKTSVDRQQTILDEQNIRSQALHDAEDILKHLAGDTGTMSCDWSVSASSYQIN